MEPISFSLAQINIQFGDPSANQKNALQYIQTASVDGSSVILFPELWTTGYDLQNGKIYAHINRDILDNLQILSRKLQIAIGGSYLLEKDHKLFNTFVLLQPNGPEIHYSKVHLFRLMEEHIFLHPGEKLSKFPFATGKAGLSVCYDLRFPEMFRRYALENVILILLVAEWPTQRIAHWQHLLRARAIENQCFMVAVNSVGKSGQETFGGCSALIGPWGETLAEANSDEEELIQAKIDPSQVDLVRETIPVFMDRRIDLYEANPDSRASFPENTEKQ